MLNNNASTQKRYSHGPFRAATQTLQTVLKAPVSLVRAPAAHVHLLASNKKPNKITGKISFGLLAGCKQRGVQILALLCELFFLDLASSVSLEALRH